MSACKHCGCEAQCHAWNGIKYCHKCKPSCMYKVAAVQLSRDFYNGNSSSKTAENTPGPATNSLSDQVLKELERATGIKQQEPDVEDQNGSIMNEAYMKQVDSGDYRIKPTKLTIDLEGEQSYMTHVRRTVIQWLEGQEVLS